MKIVRFVLSLMILISPACASGGAAPSQGAESTVVAPDGTAARPTSADPGSATPTVAAAEPTAPVPTDTPSATATASAAPAPTDTPSATATAASPTPGACGNPYYPIVQGASWNYQVSGTSSGTFTRSIVNVREDGFDDQDVFSAGVSRSGSWKCQQGDLISLTPGSGALVASAGMQADFTIESSEGLTFPADPQPGMEWTQKIVFLGQQSMNGVNVKTRNTLNASCKVIGVETVSVPAGDFEALRTNCTFKFDISLVDQAFSLATTTTSSAWHARGVGLVKSSDTSEMGATEVVLLSYAIP